MRFLLATNIRDQKGLARDAEILTARLEALGHHAVALDFRSKTLPDGAFDVAVHLEHVEDALLKVAPRNWWIPNPEQGGGCGLEALKAKRFDRVLCKTKDALRVFSDLTDRASFLGFEAADNLRPEVKRERAFFHGPGQSANRGSEAICTAWGKNPSSELPLRQPLSFVRGLSRDAFVREQNRCIFHLCPSEYEGFGHGLHEAFSVGAVVITVDAPPMNEFRGAAYYIKPDNMVPMRLVQAARVSPAAIRHAVEWCAALNTDEIMRLQARARESYEVEVAAFRVRFEGVVTEAQEEMECLVRA